MESVNKSLYLVKLQPLALLETNHLNSTYEPTISFNTETLLLAKNDLIRTISMNYILLSFFKARLRI